MDFSTKQYGKLDLRNCDCMELMAEYPDNHFDLCLTDPPYNVGREYNKYDDNMNEVDYHLWCSKWFKEAQRVSKCQVMTVGYKNLPFWFSLKPKHQIIWYKPNQCSPSPLGGFNAYESILVWGKNKKRIGHDIFTKNIAMQTGVDWHDCPKYLPAWKIILDMFVEKGDSVIDLFLGSGTTAIACYYMGFDLVGSELDEDYYKAMMERIDKETRQEELF